MTFQQLFMCPMAKVRSFSREPPPLSQDNHFRGSSQALETPPTTAGNKAHPNASWGLGWHSEYVLP